MSTHSRTSCLSCWKIAFSARTTSRIIRSQVMFDQSELVIPNLCSTRSGAEMRSSVTHPYLRYGQMFTPRQQILLSRRCRARFRGFQPLEIAHIIHRDQDTLEPYSLILIHPCSGDCCLRLTISQNAKPRQVSFHASSFLVVVRFSHPPSSPCSVDIT